MVTSQKPQKLSKENILLIIDIVLRAHIVSIQHISTTANANTCNSTPFRPVLATAMYATQSAQTKGREYASQMDANDPLKSFRTEFLIPYKPKSSMSLPSSEPARHTHW